MQMTPREIVANLNYALNYKRRDLAETMAIMRAAFHAEKNDFKSLLNELMRNAG